MALQNEKEKNLNETLYISHKKYTAYKYLCHIKKIKNQNSFIESKSNKDLMPTSLPCCVGLVKEVGYHGLKLVG